MRHAAIGARGLLALVVATASASACGDGEPAADDGPRPAVVSTAGPTPAESSPSPSATTTPGPDPSDLIGQITLDADQVAATCAADASVPDVVLRPGGLVLTICDDLSVTALDAVSGAVRWTWPPGSDSVRVGSRHVFLLENETVDPDGLADAYVSRTLTAVDLATGDESWTRTVEEWLPKKDRGDGSITVVESGGPGTSLSPQVAVSVDAWSGLDADTGDEIWHATSLDATTDHDFGDPQYVGDGVVLTFGSAAVPIWRAVDAATHKQLWRTQTPSTTSSDPLTLVGATLWQQGDDGVLAVDVRTGRITLSRRYPGAWMGIAADHTHALAVNGGSLQMFAIDDLTTPLWSVPAGSSVDPLAIGTDRVLVNSNDGIQLLDAKTGDEAESPMMDDEQTDEWGPVVDGFMTLADGSVFELGPPRETK